MLAPRAVKRKAGTKTTSNGAATSSVEKDAVSATPEVNIANGSGDDNQNGSFEVDVDGTNDARLSAATTEPTDVQKPIDENVDSVATTSEQPETSQVSKEDSDKAEHLNLLRYTIEECLSDWGLSVHHPELREKFASSKTGYVHISNLLHLRPIHKQTASLTDLTKSLTGGLSDFIQIDETGFQVKRKVPADYDLLAAMTAADWADRSLYLENIPPAPKNHPYTLFSLRAYLAELLESPVEAVRLPILFTPPNKLAEGLDTPSTAAQVGGLYSEGSNSHIDERKSNRMHVLPENGGPFKGFAFVVVRDAEKARHCLERWSWDTRESRAAAAVSIEKLQGQADDPEDEDPAEATSDAEASVLQQAEGSTSAEARNATENTDTQTGETQASATSHDSLVQLADRSGLSIMPIVQFNELRLEYLRYSRDITTLREKHEASRENYGSRHNRRSTSPETFASSKQKRPPSPERWERKPRSPSPERWERKPVKESAREKRPRTYEDAAGEYPRGCVCFVKRFNPNVRTTTLKTLFQAILEREEVSPKDHLQFVDHSRNVDSCHVRFKDASTASFFASYFSGNPRYTHVDPESTDPSEALASVKKGSDVRPIEVEVVTGTPEAIYWSKVPKGARKLQDTNKTQKLSAGNDETSGPATADSEAAASQPDALTTEDAGEHQKKRLLNDSDTEESGRAAKQVRVDGGEDQPVVDQQRQEEP